MFCEYDAAVERIRLVLDDVVEALDTVVDILSIVLGRHVARLVLEVTCITILEKEPCVPLFHHGLVFRRAALRGFAEWVEDIKF